MDKDWYDIKRFEAVKNKVVVMDIAQKTMEFTNAFKTSKVYQDYIISKKMIQERPELLEKVNHFRRETFEIQCSGTYGDYSNYEKISKLRKENDDLLSNPIIKDFMNAELKLSKAITNIYSIFAEEIDFDTEFLLL
jgi:cell fate (sporulation/competence/biofilm development) regulator YlbF (YheA/YmcA/DUF963 family)